MVAAGRFHGGNAVTPCRVFSLRDKIKAATDGAAGAVQTPCPPQLAGHLSSSMCANCSSSMPFGHLGPKTHPEECGLGTP